MTIQTNRQKLLEKIQTDSFFFKSTKPMLVLPLVTTTGCLLPIGLVGIDYSIDDVIDGPIGITILAIVAIIWMIYVWVYFFTKMKEKKEFNASALVEVRKIIQNSSGLSDEELELKINEYLMKITTERTTRLRAKEGKPLLEEKRHG
ncbi:MAG: hypothetical protein K0R18_2991 [Bacillales bacterium]|jgi:hypothetical protein|nr:hypothetical protein [Bacillales bacterium]